MFYFVIWSGRDNLLLDIEINSPIKKTAVKIQPSSNLSMGKQPMNGEHQDPYHKMCIVL